MKIVPTCPLHMQQNGLHLTPFHSKATKVRILSKCDSD